MYVRLKHAPKPGQSVVWLVADHWNNTWSASVEGKASFNHRSSDNTVLMPVGKHALVVACDGSKVSYLYEDRVFYDIWDEVANCFNRDGEWHLCAMHVVLPDEETIE